jgi:DNA invertase Pin-like site-specific DNA recombinase
MERKAVELGGNLAGVFIEPVSPGNKTAILARPAGKQLLEALQAGDMLAVSQDIDPDHARRREGS